MSAIVLDIAVDQELVVRRGDDYDYICRVINVDESAYDFTNKIVILRVLSSINPDVELFSLCSDSASEIELSAGQMILHFTSTQLEQTEDTYFYDLKIVINSKTYTWLCGDFKIRTKIDNTAANGAIRQIRIDDNNVPKFLGVTDSPTTINRQQGDFFLGTNGTLGIWNGSSYHFYSAN